MGRAKKTVDASAAAAIWTEYQRIQLTPEEKALARAETEKRVEQARRDGVYDQLLALRGTIRWSMSWQELRGKDED